MSSEINYYTAFCVTDLHTYPSQGSVNAYIDSEYLRCEALYAKDRTDDMPSKMPYEYFLYNMNSFIRRSKPSAYESTIAKIASIKKVMYMLSRYGFRPRRLGNIAVPQGATKGPKEYLLGLCRNTDVPFSMFCGSYVPPKLRNYVRGKIIHLKYSLLDTVNEGIIQLKFNAYVVKKIPKIQEEAERQGVYDISDSEIRQFIGKFYLATMPEAEIVRRIAENRESNACAYCKSSVTGEYTMQNFKYKGRLITASSRAQAIRQIMASEATTEDMHDKFVSYLEDLDIVKTCFGKWADDVAYRDDGPDPYDAKTLVDDGNDTVGKSYWTTLFMLNGGGYLRKAAEDEFYKQRRNCVEAYDEEYGDGAYEKDYESNDMERYYEFEDRYFDRMVSDNYGSSNYGICGISFSATFDDEDGDVRFVLNLPVESGVIDKYYPMTEEGLAALKSDLSRVKE